MLNGHLSLMTVKNVLNVKWESARRRIQPQDKALVYRDLLRDCENFANLHLKLCVTDKKCPRTGQRKLLVAGDGDLVLGGPISPHYTNITQTLHTHYTGG